MKTKKREIKIDHDKENDLILFSWARKGEVKHSRELKNAEIVVDFNSKGDIVGIEIFYINKLLAESQKEVEHLPKQFDKEVKDEKTNTINKRT